MFGMPSTVPNYPPQYGSIMHYVNICLDRNIVVLMIDKRSLMQKAEKRIKLSRLGL
jgi:hypothetical protein